jgi:Na+/H+ antiporter NhaD/arsenite permease-like protein
VRDHTPEKEREYLFYHFTPTLFRKVCGQMLITSLLVLLFSFEVPLKKYQKKLQQKNRKRKTRDNNEGGFVCVFFLFLWWCFVITFVFRLTSLAQSSLGPTYYHH